MINDIQIFPNPVINRLTTQSSDPRNFIAKFYDIRGQLVEMANISSDYSIDISDLILGTYILKVSHSAAVIIKK